LVTRDLCHYTICERVYREAVVAFIMASYPLVVTK